MSEITCEWRLIRAARSRVWHLYRGPGDDREIWWSRQGRGTGLGAHRIRVPTSACGELEGAAEDHPWHPGRINCQTCRGLCERLGIPLEEPEEPEEDLEEDR